MAHPLLPIPAIGILNSRQQLHSKLEHLQKRLIGDVSSVLEADKVDVSAEISCDDVTTCSELADVGPEAVGADVSSSRFGSTATKSLMSSVDPDTESGAATTTCRMGPGRRANFLPASN